LITKLDKSRVKLTELEAALYSAGHPLDMEELMHTLGSRSEKIVLRYVNELSKKLSAHGRALEVRTLPGNRAVMQLKPEYSKMVRQSTNRPLLTVGPLKTLGYIAYNQPIEQTQVLNYRGVHVYSQLKLLEDMALISREHTEKGVVIKTTSFFADYFDLSQDSEKSKLQIIELFSNMHPELVVRD
jgi:segregation and condensation protein B